MNITQIIETALAIYVAQPNGLMYTPKLVNCDPSRQDEILHIAQFLSGENTNLAIKFMNGSLDSAPAFINSLRSNGERSNPVIVKAIQLHLQNK